MQTNRLCEERGNRLGQLVKDYEALQRLHEQLTHEYEALSLEHNNLKVSHKNLKTESKGFKVSLPMIYFSSVLLME